MAWDPTTYEGQDRLQHIEKYVGLHDAFVNGGSLTPVYNVRQLYGAKGDNSTDDTAAIQSAIDAATAAFNAGVQPVDAIVYLPAGQYVISAPLVVSTTITLMGDGPQKTVIRPSAGFVGTDAIQVTPATPMSAVVVNGIHVVLNLIPTINGFHVSNLTAESLVNNCRVTSGAIGLKIDSVSGVHFSDLSFKDQTTAGIQFQGDGSTDNHFTDIHISRESAGTLAAGFDYSRATASLSDGGLWMSRVFVTNPGGTVTYGYKFASSAGSPSPLYLFMNECVADNTNGTAGLYLSNMQIVNIVNSFLDGTLVPGISISGGKNMQIEANYIIGGILFAAPDAVAVFNNIFSTGTAFQVSASPPTHLQVGGNRILDTLTDSATNLTAAQTTAAVFSQQLVYVPSAANAIDVVAGDSTASQAAYMRINNRSRFGYDGTQIIIDDNGQTKDILLKTSTVERLRILSGGGVKATSGFETGLVAPTYSASITPNAFSGNWQTITVANNTAFTINAPTNPPDASHTQELVIEILNSSGGAMGVITWDVAFILVGGAFTNPASTKKRYIRFGWNGSKWVETGRASADY